jgi:hypothetical protein
LFAAAVPRRIFGGAIAPHLFLTFLNP